MFHGVWLFKFAYLMAFNHVILQALLSFFHCQNRHFKWLLKSRVKTCKISVRFDNSDFSEDIWSISTLLLVFSWLIRYNFFKFRKRNWYSITFLFIHSMLPSHGEPMVQANLHILILFACHLKVRNSETTLGSAIF